ncbi:MAG TPA: GNAT family N-acetyltransferase [Pirellulaceae bacterium]|jgi:ribosomal protein S18 acetylase RimI-like enzyme
MHSEIRVARCDPATDKQALEIAARAWPATERLAYGQAIENLVANGLADRVVLGAARQQNRVVAAQVGQMLAGNAAIVWPPQFEAEAEIADCESFAAALGKQLAAALKQGGMHIAQSLLAPGEAESGKWLEIGGFSHAADLLYLTADVSRGPAEPPLLPFALEAFNPTAKPRLIDVIQRTYVGTLDCPRLDGLRSTADVIDGYKSVGEFRPELWFLVRHGADDVGCLLMNLHPDVQHAEIIYLAVTPEVRGRGWGLLLSQYALWLARQTKSQRAVLAVDAANEPAVQMYAVAGFDVFDRREVWLLTFPQ